MSAFPSQCQQSLCSWVGGCSGCVSWLQETASLLSVADWHSFQHGCTPWDQDTPILPEEGAIVSCSLGICRGFLFLFSAPSVLGSHLFFGLQFKESSRSYPKINTLGLSVKQETEVRKLWQQHRHVSIFSQSLVSPQVLAIGQGWALNLSVSSKEADVLFWLGNYSFQYAGFKADALSIRDRTTVREGWDTYLGCTQPRFSPFLLPEYYRCCPEDLPHPAPVG